MEILLRMLRFLVFATIALTPFIFGVRLLHIASPDLTISINDLLAECGSSAERARIDYAAPENCKNSIYWFLDNTAARGILLWSASSNKEDLVCVNELRELSDRDLVNWFEKQATVRAYGQGDSYPVEVLISVSLMNENQCF